jgi:thioredoxin 1
MNKKRLAAVFAAVAAIGLVSLSGGQNGGGPMRQAMGRGASVEDSSDAIAKKIIDAKVPVFIDFWAVWCGPCRMLMPTIKKLEEEYGGKVLFLRVNVDYNPRIASYFQVQGIPAIFIVKDRSVVQQLVGFRPESDFRTALDAVLAMPPAKDSAKAGTGAKGKTSPKSGSNL